MKFKLIPMLFIQALQAMGAAIRNDAVTIESLQARLIELNELANDVQNTADGEGRALTDEEKQAITNYLDEYKDTEQDIARREQLIANSANLNASTGRKSAPNDVVNAAPTGAPAGSSNNGTGRQYREPINHAEVGTQGFPTFGEFAKQVMNASAKGVQNIDPRLIVNAPTTYGNEGVGADGGFAIPPTFRNEIMKLIEAEDELMQMTDQLTTNGNSMTLPKDETTPWQTTGGIQCNWEGEAVQGTQSKPQLKEDLHKLKKLKALVPITEEMADDASTIESYLRSKVPEKMSFKINDAIINGTGAGMPLGFMNSGALITVAKESGQTADTVVFENIVNMWARMYAPSRRNAIWLINQDIEPQLDTMAFPTTATAVPMYMPPGGLADSPYARLKGRPVLASQAMQTLGDKGDIALVDLKKYMTLKKTMGIKAETSIHLWFDYDVVAFKFTMRLDGQPAFSSTISPLNGSNTLSPFVTLAARA